MYEQMKQTAGSMPRNGLSLSHAVDTLTGNVPMPAEPEGDPSTPRAISAQALAPRMESLERSTSEDRSTIAQGFHAIHERLRRLEAALGI